MYFWLSHQINFNFGDNRILYTNIKTIFFIGLHIYGKDIGIFLYTEKKFIKLIFLQSIFYTETIKKPVDGRFCVFFILQGRHCVSFKR